MSPSIVLFSDFGLDSGYVTSMRGICKRVDPSLDVSDGTHLLPPFDVRAASYTLQYVVPAWPDGTVFVSVVDPGVGTSRRASVAQLSNGSYVVTPDNGTLTFLKADLGIRAVREIDETHNRYRGFEDVSVFHGRDIFAYTAARLAAGVISFEEVGPEYPVEQVVLHPVHPARTGSGWVEGTVESADPFGTLETSIRNSQMAEAGLIQGVMVKVSLSKKDQSVFEEQVLFGETFGDVPVGMPILFRDLAGFVSLGLNEHSLAEAIGYEQGDLLTVKLSK